MLRILLIAFVTFATATTALGDDLVTISGRTFLNVKVTGKDALSVSITHNRGVTRVLYSEMTEADQHKYGYDPEIKQAFLREQVRQKEAVAQAARELEMQKQEALERQKREEERQLAVEQRMAQDEIDRKEQARRNRFVPSGMSVAAFRATRPTTPTVFLANAQLSDYFNYDFSDLSSPGIENLLWSVRLETPEGQDIGHGYIPKNKDRGAALFSLLKDGKWHPIVARLKYLTNSEDSGVFVIIDYKEAD